MLSVFCNELCMRMRKKSQQVMKQAAAWLAARAGLKVVSSDSVLLPKGCRPIPLHFYDVDPAVLRQLKDGNRAILHQAMKNWQASNEQTGKFGYRKDNRWGTESNPKIWHRDIFPFLNSRTVKAMIADLVEAALLVVDGAWCQPLKAEFSGAEQLPLFAGKDFQQPGKVFHSSIESKGNSPKKKTSKQTSISPRKDAVADFRIPNPSNQADVEIHESRDGEVEGRDVLFDLPGELVTAWTDAKLPLEELVAQHGVDRVKAKWQEAKDFRNRVAGLRTLLGKPPTPRFAPPPSSGDTTEKDIDANDTPDIDGLLAAPKSFSDYLLKDTDAKPERGLCAPTISPEPANWWKTAYQQLEIQLDRASFETWLRGVRLVSVEGNLWQFTAVNQYAADMLQHRLYREIRRVLSDVLGVKHDQIELRFEVAEAVQHG